MRKRIARAALLVMVVGAMAALAACGGSDSKDDSSSSSSSSSSSAGGSIKVELSEWTVKPSATSAKAGDVKFEVTNKGAAPHEFVVIKTDLAADKLPVNGSTSTVDEKQVPPVGRTANIQATKEEDKSFTLTAGKYVLLCNLAAHYGQGMHVAFTVN